MPTAWYCRRSPTGGVYGPFTPADLRRLVDLGKLQPSHQVRAGKDGRWETAGEVLPQLFGTDAEPVRRDVAEPPEPPAAEVIDFEPPAPDRPPRRTAQKYPVLRFIATVYGILAVIGFGLYAIVAIFAAASGLFQGAKDKDGVPVFFALIGAIFLLLAGALVAITLFAIKEAIMLMIDIEHSLRQIRNHLSNRE